VTQVLTLTAWASREGGGLQSAVRDLVRAGSSADSSTAKQHVMALADQHSAADLSDWAPVQPELHSYLGPDNFRFSPSLLRAALRERYDCMHLHGIWMFPSLVARAVQARHGTPLIISPHGMLDPWILQRGRLKKRAVGLLWEHHNWRSARAFRALSSAEASAIRAVAPSSSIAIIANGVHLPALPVAARSDQPFTLLFLGRLHEKKGLHRLLDAWAAVVQQNPGAQPRLRVCGWGDASYEAQCRAQTNALGIDQSVTFVGPVFGADKERELGNCDALILPSVSEGLPVAILEAWSYAKPTLMTTQCNLDIGFEQGCALKIELDSAAMADSITQFVRLAREARSVMGQRARQLAQRDFTWTRIAQQVAALTQWCTGAGPRPETLI
jgi:glycosyltransferase involved in cell wall biosynthesis